MAVCSYKAAIIGLGNIAWKYTTPGKKNFILTHADAYRQNPEVEIIAACCPEKADGEDFAKFYNVPVFETAGQLLENTSPDIVSICSPAEFHFEHTLKCIEASVPMIWLEKPPSLNISEINILIEKQKRAQSTVLVNYQRRYCSYYRQLKELYLSKKLGGVEFINVIYSKGLLHNGSHMIDIVLYLLGDKTELAVENIVLTSDRENPSFMLRSPDGICISVTGMSLPYHCLDITLTCQKGRASILHGGMEARLETKAEHELFKGFYRLKERKNYFSGNGNISESMSNALGDLILAYTQKKQPKSNLATSAETINIIAKVQKFIDSIQ